MEDHRQLSRLTTELQILQSRVLELEQWLGNFKTPGAAVSVAALNPAIWTSERFAVRITADHADGTYQARRLIATGNNSFSDDPDDTETITAADVSERNGYTGKYAIGDIVQVDFDGLDDTNNGIYHIW
ncbi:MAG: hypothetical protein WC975_07310 [Phycisphaerae bacterium]